MLSKLKNRQEGFTIIELLIVIVIIGILAALVITTFSNQTQKARDTQRKTDLDSINKQLEVYYNENSEYPTAAELNTLLPDLDAAALQNPQDGGVAGASGDVVAVNSTTLVPASYPAGVAKNYFYWAVEDVGSIVGNLDCTGAESCQEYCLFAPLEQGGATWYKHSLNDSAVPIGTCQ